jgi:galactose mutarotase-like enzyme
MVCKIENALLTAEINDIGAELSSLKSKQSGIEYLWQGNPSVWSGRSPLLFPIIGQLFEGKFRYNNKDYFLPKHGFARESLFEIISIDEYCAVFLLKSNNKTMTVYPFNFEFHVKFELTEKRIKVTHTVSNTSTGEMFFSVGAHPGFNCCLGDYLEFAGNETLVTERIDENALIIDEKFPLLNNTKTIEITPELFKNDALFLSGYKSPFITLKSPRHSRELRFDFGKAPFLGIWAKPSAPYVCIEPWYGINDSYSKNNDISETRGIQKLEATQSFQFSWSAEIIEPGN